MAWSAASVAAGVVTPARGNAAERLTVILDWLLNVNHAALFAAQHGGAFARAGLDVALVSPSDPDSPCRLVAAGQAELAVSYGTQINLLDEHGLGLVRIATLVNRPLNSVMALGPDIRTLADLKGRRIGVSVGGVEEMLLDVMLRSAGIEPHEVTAVRVGYQMVPALLTHRLDAAIGAFRNSEVLEVRRMGLAPIVFAPEDHGVPPYDELILVARRGGERDPKLARFVAALGEGAALLQAQPEALWEAFAAAHPELATPLNRAAWTITMPMLAPRPALLDTRRYLQFQDFALAQGVITKSLPIEQFAIQLAA